MRTLTLSQIADMLGVSIPTVRRIKNELPGAVRVSKRVRFREDAIRSFIEAGGCSQGRAA